MVYISIIITLQIHLKDESRIGTPLRQNLLRRFRVVKNNFFHFRTLQTHAKKLVEQKHFDSNFIRNRVAEIVHFQQKVMDAYKGRETYLKHLQTSLEFQRDVTEVESWMKSKMENFSKAAKEYESGSLSEKIRFLQKYTVFENEIRKHEVTIKGIVAKGQVQ